MPGGASASPPRHLGLGVAWRVGLAEQLERQSKLDFVELHAEAFLASDNFAAGDPLPPELGRLLARGMPNILHGVTLNVGGAERPTAARMREFADLVERTHAVMVSDHLCYVRAGGLESGHLLPLPRTRETIEIIVENVLVAKESLRVPLALENIATLFEWPGAEMDEASFLSEILERTDTLLLLDLTNLYANSRNLGWNASAFLDRLPLERLAYCHMAGGVVRHGLYLDTHSSTVAPGALALLEELASRRDVPGVVIERDDDFPTVEGLAQELDTVAATLARGTARRRAPLSVSHAHAGPG